MPKIIHSGRLTINITDEQLAIVNERISTVVDAWKRHSYYDKSMCIYELARDCYLQGLVDRARKEVQDLLKKAKG